jgi:hypothetical protein
MADEAAPSPVDHVAVLRGMSMRIRAGEPTDPHEIERALEAGFGALIALEAELSVLQRASGDTGRDAEAAAEVIGHIKALHAVLIDVRKLAVPPGESRVGYGFVLPAPRHQTHGSPN